jgi:DNA ligase-1
MVNLGYEGAIVRDPRAPYKEGRSTVKQGWMLKVKRFADDEAEVIGTVEQMRNDNEATVDELGYTKRSHHKEGKTAAGVLGALSVRGTTGQFKGVEFEIGTGFTAEQRRNLWAGREYLIGKLVSYKYFPVGVKDKPRFPTFKAFRDRRDI